MSYQPKVYREQGAERMVVASGGSFDIESGGEIDIESGGSLKIAGTAVTAKAGEINALTGAAAAATFSIGAEANDIRVVSVQLKDGAGVDLAARGAVQAYLSNDANGDAIASATPSGAVAAGTDGLLLPSGGDSKKIFGLVSEADGDIDVSITDTAGSTYYLALILPNGKLAVSGAIAFTT
jgi:hypothetical protein